MINVGSDFSGVGAFIQALIRLKIDYKEVFACDMDKYARQTYNENYGNDFDFPEDVYDREIPKEPLDIYVSSPPCQSFSLAGKRKGEDDKRGVLFYNSHEFIVKNKPRYFIFENVKGLLSDDVGKTFQRWLDYLGGKSVNGNPVIFPLEESVPYHIYHKVLNAKDYGVPQNRERVFIVGIRDDADNNFHWPKGFHLVKRLKDVLETEVDKKYFLSESNIDALLVYNNRQLENGNGFSAKFRDTDTTDTMDALKVGGGGKDDLIKVKSATKKGYEIANEFDSINLSNLNSETRRGRVGKEVAQTLDTACNQAVMIAAMRGRNPNNNSDRTTGAPMQQTLEINKNGTSNTITSVQKDNLVLNINQEKKFNDLRVNTDVAGCITNAIGRAGSSDEYMASVKRNALITNSIRRLTPRECFRLMDFEDSFTWPVSNSQAYKQAGNSIVVACLVGIIKNLKLNN